MFLDFLSTFPVDSLKRFWLRIFIIFSLYSEFCNSEFSSIFFSIFFVSLLKDCDHKTFLWKFSLNSGLWDSKFSLVSFLFFQFPPLTFRWISTFWTQNILCTSPFTLNSDFSDSEFQHSKMLQFFSFSISCQNFKADWKLQKTQGSLQERVRAVMLAQ